MRKKDKWCQVEAKQMWHGAKGESWQETVRKVSSEHRACESATWERLSKGGKRMKWQNPETRLIWYSACKLRMGSVYHLRDADALDQISTSSVIQNTISQPGNHPSNRHSYPQHESDSNQIDSSDWPSDRSHWCFSDWRIQTFSHPDTFELSTVSFKVWVQS